MVSEAMVWSPGFQQEAASWSAPICQATPRWDPVSPSLNVAVSNRLIKTPPTPERRSQQQPRALMSKQRPYIGPSLTLARLSSVFLRKRFSKLVALECGGPQTKRQEMTGENRNIFSSSLIDHPSLNMLCQRLIVGPLI